MAIAAQPLATQASFNPMQLNQETAGGAGPPVVNGIKLNPKKLGALDTTNNILIEIRNELRGISASLKTSVENQMKSSMVGFDNAMNQLWETSASTFFDKIERERGLDPESKRARVIERKKEKEEMKIANQMERKATKLGIVSSDLRLLNTSGRIWLGKGKTPQEQLGIYQSVNIDLRRGMYKELIRIRGALGGSDKAGIQMQTPIDNNIGILKSLDANIRELPTAIALPYKALGLLSTVVGTVFAAPLKIWDWFSNIAKVSDSPEDMLKMAGYRKVDSKQAMEEFMGSAFPDIANRQTDLLDSIDVSLKLIGSGAFQLQDSHFNKKVVSKVWNTQLAQFQEKKELDEFKQKMDTDIRATIKESRGFIKNWITEKTGKDKELNENTARIAGQAVGVAMNSAQAEAAREFERGKLGSTREEYMTEQMEQNRESFKTWNKALFGIPAIVGLTMKAVTKKSKLEREQEDLAAMTEDLPQMKQVKREIVQDEQALNDSINLKKERISELTSTSLIGEGMFRKLSKRRELQQQIREEELMISELQSGESETKKEIDHSLKSEGTGSQVKSGKGLGVNLSKSARDFFRKTIRDKLINSIEVSTDKVYNVIDAAQELQLDESIKQTELLSDIKTGTDILSGRKSSEITSELEFLIAAAQKEERTRFFKALMLSGGAKNEEFYKAFAQPAACGAEVKAIARQSGGPVQPYLIGEKGPEIMVPAGVGTIVPLDIFKGQWDVLIEIRDILDKKIFGAIGNLFGGTGSAIGGTGKGIGSVIEGSAKGLGGLLNNIFEGLGTFVKGALKGVEFSGESLARFVSGTFDLLQTGLQKLGFDVDLSGMKEGVLKFGSSVMKWFSDLDLGGKMKSFLNTAKEQFEWGKLVLGGIYDAAKEKIQDGIMQLKGWWDSTLPKVKEKLVNASMTIQRWVGEGIGKVQLITSQLQAWWKDYPLREKLTNMTMGIQRFVGETIGRAQLAISGVIDGIKERWKGFKDKITAPFKKGKELLGKGVDAIKSGVQGFLGIFKRKPDTGDCGTEDKLKRLRRTVCRWIKTLFSNIYNSIAEIAPEPKEGLIGKIMSGFKNLGEKAREGIDKLGVMSYSIPGFAKGGQPEDDVLAMINAQEKITPPAILEAELEEQEKQTGSLESLEEQGDKQLKLFKKMFRPLEATGEFFQKHGESMAEGLKPDQVERKNKIKERLAAIEAEDLAKENADIQKEQTELLAELAELNKKAKPKGKCESFLGKLIGGVGGLLAGAAGFLSNMFGNFLPFRLIGNAISGMFTAIFSGKIMEKIGDLVTSTGKGLQKAATTIANGVGSIASKAMDTISKIMPALMRGAAFLKTLMTPVVNFIGRMLASLNPAVLITMVLAGGISFLLKDCPAFQDFVQKIKDGLYYLFSKPKEWYMEYIHWPLVNMFESVASFFADLKELPNRMWKGITDWWDGLFGGPLFGQTDFTGRTFTERINKFMSDAIDGLLDWISTPFRMIGDMLDNAGDWIYDQIMDSPIGCLFKTNGVKSPKAAREEAEKKRQEALEEAKSGEHDDAEFARRDALKYEVMARAQEAGEQVTQIEDVSPEMIKKYMSKKELIKETGRMQKLMKTEGSGYGDAGDIDRLILDLGLDPKDLAKGRQLGNVQVETDKQQKILDKRKAELEAFEEKIKQKKKEGLIVDKTSMWVSGDMTPQEVAQERAKFEEYVRKAQDQLNVGKARQSELSGTGFMTSEMQELAKTTKGKLGSKKAIDTRIKEFESKIAKGKLEGDDGMIYDAPGILSKEQRELSLLKGGKISRRQTTSPTDKLAKVKKFEGGIDENRAWELYNRLLSATSEEERQAIIQEVAKGRSAGIDKKFKKYIDVGKSKAVQAEKLQAKLGTATGDEKTIIEEQLKKLGPIKDITDSASLTRFLEEQGAKLAASAVGKQTSAALDEINKNIPPEAKELASSLRRKSGELLDTTTGAISKHVGSSSSVTKGLDKLNQGIGNISNTTSNLYDRALSKGGDLVDNVVSDSKVQSMVDKGQGYLNNASEMMENGMEEAKKSLSPVDGEGVFDKGSLKHLRELHPDLQSVMISARKKANFKIIEGTRSESEQNDLVAKGRSKARFPNSRHNYYPAIAVDIAPLNADDSIPWNDLGSFRDLSDVVMETANEMSVPIKWGGTFKNFFDGPHYQLPKGYGGAKLAAFEDGGVIDIPESQAIPILAHGQENIIDSNSSKTWTSILTKIERNSAVSANSLKGLPNKINTDDMTEELQATTSSAVTSGGGTIVNSAPQVVPIPIPSVPAQQPNRGQSNSKEFLPGDEYLDSIVYRLMRATNFDDKVNKLIGYDNALKIV